ncbi:unnamed protein product [Urochloa decumbens]|uniref:DUF7595 domain-containing protein n=1 Tax=Urochloa decumbens TaxID=240449 RepID=A0ABC8YL05_9POAL
MGALPEDLLLEIAARADDAATVVRCAAASKPLRRAILGPGFRRQLAGRLGLSFQPDSASTATMVPGAARTTTTSRPPQPLSGITVVDWGIPEWLEPVAARDGLLVLRRWDDTTGSSLSVRDTLTGGGVTSLPPMGIVVHGHEGFPCPPPALLAVGGGADRVFELLAAYWDGASLMIRIFTSKTGAWGLARAAVPCPGGAQLVGRLSRANPAVVGRVAHWLCLGADETPHGVLAVDADTVDAAAVDLPPDYDSGMRHGCRSEAHVRLVAVDGRLGLVIAESLAVSVWTLAAASWSRQVVVGAPELERRAGLLEGDVSSLSPVEFLGFAEKSGAVVVLVTAVSLNLGTKAVATLWRGESKLGPWVSQVFLHEADLASVLQAMKSF